VKGEEQGGRLDVFFLYREITVPLRGIVVSYADGDRREREGAGPCFQGISSTNKEEEKK